MTLGSVAAGMLLSAVRWALLDTLHHRTGIPQPDWDFARFPGRAAAFDSLVQDHYRYYQHYGNMLVAVGLLATSFIWGQRLPVGQAGWWGAGLLVTALVLYLGSRDALRKYYARTAAVLNGGAAPGGGSV